MEEYERKGSMENDREEIYSIPVRNNDYYLTITESKKRFEDDGSRNFEKHKIFLYKEDFDKFSEGLQEVLEYTKKLLKESGQEYNPASNYNIDFN